MLVMLVPALAGLASEFAFFEFFYDALFWLLALVSGLFIARHPHIVIDVYTGEIHQFKRADRMPEGRLADRVYILEGGYAILVARSASSREPVR